MFTPAPPRRKRPLAPNGPEFSASSAPGSRDLGGAGLDSRSMNAQNALLCLSAVLLVVATSCGEQIGPVVIVPPLPAPVDMLRVVGTSIQDGRGQQVVLRGLAFGNEVYTGVRVPLAHHSEQDFERLNDMGMNSVRFYMNYLTFEEDRKPGEYKQAGWEWLDRNVAWAKAHGIYLVLNMHAPPGGYQSLGKGVALWNDPAMQDRFIALWQAIAARYAFEPTIAGFDLLNEPVPTQNKQQWRDLATRTIAAVRQVDAHHMIFVERVNAVGKDWSEDRERNFFRVDDPNVVYEFHFYKPFHFTHQGAPWVDFAADEGRYPDPTVAEVEWFMVRSEKQIQSAPLPAGDSDWTEYSTPALKVEDERWMVGKPVLGCDANAGKAWFDQLTLERTGSDGRTEALWTRDLSTRRGWYFWSQDGRGRAVADANGHGDQTSLLVEGTLGPANLGADPLRFIPERGASYRLRGFMKGQVVSAQARCTLGLEFFSANTAVLPRGKAYLEAELDAYLDWGKREGVPLYLGEFGTIRKSFEQDRGGLAWVSDMLDLAREKQLSFAYHAYHEDYFALYYGGGVPRPERSNQPLIQLFTDKLRDYLPPGNEATEPPIAASGTSPVPAKPAEKSP